MLYLTPRTLLIAWKQDSIITIHHLLLSTIIEILALWWHLMEQSKNVQLSIANSKWEILSQSYFQPIIMVSEVIIHQHRLISHIITLTNNLMVPQFTRLTEHLHIRWMKSRRIPRRCSRLRASQIWENHLRSDLSWK